MPFNVTPKPTEEKPGWRTFAFGDTAKEADGNAGIALFLVRTGETCAKAESAGDMTMAVRVHLD